MKKTKKVSKTTKSPRSTFRRTSRSAQKNSGGPSKLMKPLVLVIGVLLIGAGGIAYKFYPMSKVTTATNDKIFCSGVDAINGDRYIVKYSANISKDQGHVRVFKATNIPPVPSTMAFQDVVAAIEYQGADGGATRANLRLSANENLQIFRDCGEKPVCRLELVHHLTPAMLAKAKIELRDLEKEEAKISKELDTDIIKGKKLKKKKTSASKLATQKIEQKLQVLNIRLAELDPQIKMTRELVSTQGADMQTIDLKPDQTGSWCSDLAH